MKKLIPILTAPVLALAISTAHAQSYTPTLQFDKTGCTTPMDLHQTMTMFLETEKPAMSVIVNHPIKILGLNNRTKIRHYQKKHHTVWRYKIDPEYSGLLIATGEAKGVVLCLVADKLLDKPKK